MFAVIKAGGRQYKVKPDDVIKVNRLPVEEGDVIAFEDVILFSDGTKTQAGSPRVSGVTVAGQVIEQARGAKIIAFKKRRRKNSRRKRGHKQDLSIVRITEILTGGKKPDLSAVKPVKPSKSAGKQPATSHGEEDMAKRRKKAKKSTKMKKTTKRKTRRRKSKR